MISLITQAERRTIQRLPFCYLCGQFFEIGDSKNRDHVPPDSIFKVDHKDPLILPTHERCNSAHAIIDEKIAQLIALRYGKVPADPQRRRLIVDPKIGAITNLDIEEAVWYWIAGFHAALYKQPRRDGGGFATFSTKELEAVAPACSPGVGQGLGSLERWPYSPSDTTAGVHIGGYIYSFIETTGLCTAPGVLPGDDIPTTTATKLLISQSSQLERAIDNSLEPIFGGTTSP